MMSKTPFKRHSWSDPESEVGPAGRAAWRRGFTGSPTASPCGSNEAIGLRLLDDPPGRQAPCPVEVREDLAVLHQEIDRLPPKYRLPSCSATSRE